MFGDLVCCRLANLLGADARASSSITLPGTRAISSKRSSQTKSLQRPVFAHNAHYAIMEIMNIHEKLACNNLDNSRNPMRKLKYLQEILMWWEQAWMNICHLLVGDSTEANLSSGKGWKRWLDVQSAVWCGAVQCSVGLEAIVSEIMQH